MVKFEMSPSGVTVSTQNFQLFLSSSVTRVKACTKRAKMHLSNPLIFVSIAVGFSGLKERAKIYTKQNFFHTTLKDSLLPFLTQNSHPQVRRSVVFDEVNRPLSDANVNHVQDGELGRHGAVANHLTPVPLAAFLELCFKLTLLLRADFGHLGRGDEERNEARREAVAAQADEEADEERGEGSREVEAAFVVAPGREDDRHRDGEEPSLRLNSANWKTTNLKLNTHIVPWTMDMKTSNSSLYAEIVTILNHLSLLSWSVHFWVELKAWTGLCCLRPI